MPLFAQAVDAVPNPALGVLIFVLGGLAGAIFYLPFKKVKNWAWESYWMIYAVVGLVVVPWVLAICTSPNVFSVIKAAPTKETLYCFLCGAAWGVGGLTWGLMIRYLGVGLGLAIGCGLCSAAGTLIPPIIKGEFIQLIRDNAGNLNHAGVVSLGGVVVSLIGIILVGAAGMSKESELPEEEKKKAVAEFNFKKGMLIAVFSGLMSAAMSFGLQGGAVLEATACPLFTPSQIDERYFADLPEKLRKIDLDFGLTGEEKLSTSFEEKINQVDLVAELNRIVQSGNIFHGTDISDLRPDIEKRIAMAKNDRNATLRMNRYLLEKEYPEIIKVKTPQLAVLDQDITTLTWRGMPVLVVVLLGGFAVNGVWCLFLNVKNGTTGDYLKSTSPLASNFLFAGLAGAIWCSQFVCFKTGEPAMGKLSYVGWAVLMASAILFSTLLGIFLGEWRKTSARTRWLLTLGILLLVATAVISGWSGYLKQ
ncbi:MAG: hypothetical protein JW959_06535 [Pirellulales bacterium]|nr:hypothetical protein [Pirellulales bacterium]